MTCVYKEDNSMLNLAKCISSVNKKDTWCAGDAAYNILQLNSCHKLEQTRCAEGNEIGLSRNRSTSKIRQ